jgi:hypothetical protein
MSQEDFRTEIQIDERLESYASFFDHAWASRFVDASQGTLLYEAAHDLCLDWKGIALASRMSWLMVHSLEKFYEGFSKTDPSFSGRLTRALGEYVASHSSLSNMRKKELIGIVGELGLNVQEDMKRQPSPIEPKMVWADYLKVKEMGWALWSSQRTAYGSLYFGYENFLRNAVGLARGEPDYRAFKYSVIRRDFEGAFGEPLALECIDDPEIEIARLARHCLTHNGGKPSPELNGTTHKIRVQNGRLQIFPEDVRALFSLLTNRVLKITTAAQTLPVFKPAKLTG